MAERVVVALRSRRVSVKGTAGDHLQTTKALSERATALGGRVVAWSAAMLAFDFGLDELEDAVDLLIAGSGGEAGLDGFSAGIAQGELEPVLDVEAGSKVALCWGPALVRAHWLARIAREGEALVDQAFDAVRAGTLLTRGSRIGRIGEERLRGLRVDLEHPMRGALVDTVAPLCKPALVQHDALIAEMMVRAGSLGIVRAGRGAGGSRLLEELVGSLEHARILVLSPHPVGEPLGCLRRALDRERAEARGPVVLAGGSADLLDRLLEGKGLSVDGAAELLASWLAPESDSAASGAVLIDDAGEVDGDTLEAVARGCLGSSDPYRVIIRIGPHDEIPPSLDELPEGPEIRVSPLSRSAGAELAAASLSLALDDAPAARWAKRGGGSPVGIREALAFSLQCAELVADDEHVKPRIRLGGRGRAQPPRHWILKRFQLLDSSHRAVLTALAVLGGEADVVDVEELVRRVANVPVDLADSQSELEACCWLRVRKPELVALPGATHRDVILECLPAGRVGEWHRAASVVLEASDKALVRASAVSHAALAGDLRRASRLAVNAARTARDAGLDETATALEALIQSEDPTKMMRRLTASVYPGASAAPPASSPAHSVGPSVMPPDGWDASAKSRSSYPPLKVPSVAPAPAGAKDVPKAPKLPADVARLAEPSAEASKLEAEGDEDAIESLAPSEFDAIESDSPADAVAGRAGEVSASDVEELADVTEQGRSASDRLSELELSDSMLAPPSDSPHERGESVDRREEIAESQPEPSVPAIANAVAALRKGNHEAVDEMVRDLRARGGRTRLADRLEAMATLSRGQTGGAIALLRTAADRAKEAAPADRCRAALAHGVGLAAAGRLRDALLEALDGLARARDSGDARGEQACVKFIAHLSESAGDEGSASAWRAAAGD